MLRVTLSVMAGLVALIFILNLLVAIGATHHIAQGELLGVGKIVRRDPVQFGLAFENVTYGLSGDAWWIPADSPLGCVVMVHGYDPFIDPKSGDPGPLLDLAAHFHQWGYGTLIINLGYATGAHPYSGGELESADVTQAVNWCAERHLGRVGLWGFSAGGSAALLAASNGAPVAAVAADSAFADAGTVITEQASRVTRLPTGFLMLVPPLMTALAYPGPVNLLEVLSQQPIDAPVLLIHGQADSAIAPDNLVSLQRVTDAAIWKVPAADHIRSYQVSTAEYLSRARTFLDAHLKFRAPPEP